MQLKDGIYSHLSSQAGLAALVGTRIYPGIKGKNAAAGPYVVFQTASDHTQYAMGTDIGVRRALIDFSAWATTLPAADDVADQIEAALNGQRKVTWGGAGGVVIQTVYLVDRSDIHDPATEQHGVVVEAEVIYEA